MILVLLGSQDYKFDRLINAVDNFALENKNVKFVIQTGRNNYETSAPNIDKFDFVAKDEFEKIISDAELIITHGGAASLISSLVAGRKIIAFPRLKDYNEQIDNHQVEIVDKFVELGYILKADEKSLDATIKFAATWTPTKYSKPNTNFNSRLTEIIKG